MAKLQFPPWQSFPEGRKGATVSLVVITAPAFSNFGFQRKSSGSSFASIVAQFFGAWIHSSAYVAEAHHVLTTKKRREFCRNLNHGLQTCPGMNTTEQHDLMWHAVLRFQSNSFVENCSCQNPKGSSMSSPHTCTCCFTDFTECIIDVGCNYLLVTQIASKLYDFVVKGVPGIPIHNTPTEYKRKLQH